MFMQNIGRYYTALIISVSRQGIFYIPLLYILPAVCGSSNPLGLYLVQPAADILAFICGLVLAVPAYKKLQNRT